MPENLKLQKGFAPILVLLIVAVFLVLGGIIVFRNLPRQSLSPSTHDQSYNQADNQDKKWPALWGPPDPNCQKNSSVRFSASPIRVDDIEFIEPIGELREGHIMPGDHIGINYKTSPSSTPIKVYAPADGNLIMVEKHPYAPPTGYPQDMRHYHVYLIHSCTLFSGFVHLTELDQAILDSNPELKKINQENSSQFKNILVNIPVKAGQVLGTTWSFGLLGMVTVDLNKTNSGYLNPDSYKGENWRIHSVSPFEYFTKALKDQLLAKNPRTAEPRGGKIDFDIEGKLVGNWFQEGTGGFRDESVAPKQCGNFPCPYWDGHIAFVYDYIDPAQLRVSVGHNWGLSDKTPYGVKGNSPDFKDVGISGDLVKYELVGLKDISRDKGYETQASLVTLNDEDKILGTLLAQIMDKGTIKLEIFPNKNKDQVASFTSSARIYHR